MDRFIESGMTEPYFKRGVFLAPIVGMCLAINNLAINILCLFMLFWLISWILSNAGRELRKNVAIDPNRYLPKPALIVFVCLTLLGQYLFSMYDWWSCHGELGITVTGLPVVVVSGAAVFYFYPKAVGAVKSVNSSSNN